MIRDEDVSGVSGTGPVGEIVEFESGWVAVSFYGYTADIPNIIVYSELSHAEKIHGHKGRTRIVERKVPTDFVGEYGWKPAPTEEYGWKPAPTEE